jgi:hypothetical protein
MAEVCHWQFIPLEYVRKWGFFRTKSSQLKTKRRRNIGNINTRRLFPSEIETDHFRLFSRAKCTDEQMKQTAAQYLGNRKYGHGRWTLILLMRRIRWANNSIPIYIQQDATLHSFLYLETALHVSGGTSKQHQERIHLYLQHLVFVTPLLLSAAIVEELEPVSVCCGWRMPLSLRLSHQHPLHTSILPHTRHMPCPSHSSRFYHPYNIG